MKKMAKALEDLVWVSQLGLSLIMPILLLMGLCYWLTTSRGAGNWVYLPGVLFGLGAGASSFLSFWRLMQRRHEMEQKEKPNFISFNRHD